MKVSLISPYPDITNYGLRSISAHLRANGIQTQVICMPDFAGDGDHLPAFVKATLRLRLIGDVDSGGDAVRHGAGEDLLDGSVEGRGFAVECRGKADRGV